MWQISKMAKRKTFKTMDTDERLAVRREMVKEAEALIRHNFPNISKGAVRVKAYKFVEDSLAKEFKDHGKTDGSNAQSLTIQ